MPGTSCSVFPSDNVWNTDISSLPVDPHSDDWLHSMHAGSTNLHPDFGPPNYGMPFTVVKHSTKRHSVHFHYASESDKARYPFTSHTPIEGGSDRHALMLDRSNCRLYELYGAQWNRGHPRAGSGAIFNLRGDALRPAGWTSADAAGLPIFPGLVRYDEIARGFIGHAIRFTADVTDNHYLWPARHEAGVSDLQAPPMGARFRLKAGLRRIWIQCEGTRRTRSDEDVRPHPGRQRIELVFPGHTRQAVDEQSARRAEVRAGLRLRSRR